MSFKRVNLSPIEVEYVVDEHDENRDFEASFWCNNRRYYISDFIRVHENPWIYDDFPEYIHAYEAENYYKPLYIELLDDNEHVNAYEWVD